MVGRELDDRRGAERHAGDAERRGRARGRRASGPTATGRRRRCAASRCSVRAGEILAVAGVAGNGQRELAEAITGMRPSTRGSIRGARAAGCAAATRGAAIRAGIAHVPEDRLGTGVAPSLSIASNSVLKSYRAARSRGPVLPLRPDPRRDADELIQPLRRARRRTHATPARQLSGGNLQKVVLGREFSGQPRVLVAASPTRGLDVGAIESVHGYLREAAADGVGDPPDQRGPRRDPRARATASSSCTRGASSARSTPQGATVERDRPADGGRGPRMTIRIERRLEQPRWLAVAVPVGSIVARVRC